MSFIGNEGGEEMDFARPDFLYVADTDTRSNEVLSFTFHAIDFTIVT